MNSMFVSSDVLSINHFLNEKKPCVVFIDIDDTIINPCSLSAKNGLMNEIKAKKDSIPHFEKVLSQWRLQRKIELTDPLWPSFIEKLKEKTPVYGLTKMESGSFGDIPSVEEWRYNELKNFQILFSSFKGKMVCESHGIFYVNPKASKGDVVLEFFAHYPCDQIVFIDDLLENLQAVENVCKNRNIDFLGIHFKRNLPPPYKEIMDFQYKMLVENFQWIEDEEACLKIKVNDPA